MSDYSKQIDEILDNHKRWVIESTLPANSFNEATIAGIDERAKAKLQHLLRQVVHETECREAKYQLEWVLRNHPNGGARMKEELESLIMHFDRSLQKTQEQ